MARSINITSPGVEIAEKDLSLRVETPVGTQVLVPGFASQGPVSQPVLVTSASELDSIFGTPSTPAEKYFYYSCREVLNSPAVLNAVRLPYGENKGEGYDQAYSALVYPMEYKQTTTSEGTWSIKAPTCITLNPVEYNCLKTGAYSFIGLSQSDTDFDYTFFNDVIISPLQSNLVTLPQSEYVKFNALANKTGTQLLVGYPDNPTEANLLDPDTCISNVVTDGEVIPVFEVSNMTGVLDSNVLKHTFNGTTPSDPDFYKIRKGMPYNALGLTGLNATSGAECYVKGVDYKTGEVFLSRSFTSTITNQTITFGGITVASGTDDIYVSAHSAEFVAALNPNPTRTRVAATATTPENPVDLFFTRNISLVNSTPANSDTFNLSESDLEFIAPYSYKTSGTIFASTGKATITPSTIIGLNDITYDWKSSTKLESQVEAFRYLYDGPTESTATKYKLMSNIDAVTTTNSSITFFIEDLKTTVNGSTTISSITANETLYYKEAKTGNLIAFAKVSTVTQTNTPKKYNKWKVAENAADSGFISTDILDSSIDDGVPIVATSKNIFKIQASTTIANVPNLGGNVKDVQDDMICTPLTVTHQGSTASNTLTAVVPRDMNYLTSNDSTSCNLLIPLTATFGNQNDKNKEATALSQYVASLFTNSGSVEIDSYKISQDATAPTEKVWQGLNVTKVESVESTDGITRIKLTFDKIISAPNANVLASTLNQSPSLSIANTRTAGTSQVVLKSFLDFSRTVDDPFNDIVNLAKGGYAGSDGGNFINTINGIELSFKGTSSPDKKNIIIPDLKFKTQLDAQRFVDKFIEGAYLFDSSVVPIVKATINNVEYPLFSVPIASTKFIYIDLSDSGEYITALTNIVNAKTITKIGSNTITARTITGTSYDPVLQRMQVNFATALTTTDVANTTGSYKNIATFSGAITIAPGITTITSLALSADLSTAINATKDLKIRKSSIPADTTGINIEFLSNWSVTNLDNNNGSIYAPAEGPTLAAGMEVKSLEFTKQASTAVANSYIKFNLNRPLQAGIAGPTSLTDPRYNRYFTLVFKNKIQANSAASSSIKNLSTSLPIPFKTVAAGTTYVQQPIIDTYTDVYLNKVWREWVDPVPAVIELAPSSAFPTGVQGQFFNLTLKDSNGAKAIPYFKTLDSIKSKSSLSSLDIKIPFTTIYTAPPAGTPLKTQYFSVPKASLPPWFGNDVPLWLEDDLSLNKKLNTGGGTSSIAAKIATPYTASFASSTSTINLYYEPDLRLTYNKALNDFFDQRNSYVFTAKASGSPSSTELGTLYKGSKRGTSILYVDNVVSKNLTDTSVKDLIGKAISEITLTKTPTYIKKIKGLVTTDKKLWPIAPVDTAKFTSGESFTFTTIANTPNVEIDSVTSTSIKLKNVITGGSTTANIQATYSGDGTSYNFRYRGNAYEGYFLFPVPTLDQFNIETQAEVGTSVTWSTVTNNSVSSIDKDNVVVTLGTTVTTANVTGDTEFSFGPGIAPAPSNVASSVLASGTTITGVKNLGSNKWLIYLSNPLVESLYIDGDILDIEFAATSQSTLLYVRKFVADNYLSVGWNFNTTAGYYQTNVVSITEIGPLNANIQLVPITLDKPLLKSAQTGYDGYKAAFDGFGLVSNARTTNPYLWLPHYASVSKVEAVTGNNNLIKLTFDVPFIANQAFTNDTITLEYLNKVGQYTVSDAQLIGTNYRFAIKDSSGMNVVSTVSSSGSATTFAEYNALFGGVQTINSNQYLCLENSAFQNPTMLTWNNSYRTSTKPVITYTADANAVSSTRATRATTLPQISLNQPTNYANATKLTGVSLRARNFTGVDSTPFAGSVQLVGDAPNQTLQIYGGMLVLNELQTTVNELGEGYYIGITDNSSMADNTYNSVSSVATLNMNRRTTEPSQYATVSASTLETSLTATADDANNLNKNSLSETLEKNPFIDFVGGEYKDFVSFGIFKLSKSSVDQNKLTVQNAGIYQASFDSTRTSVGTNGNASFDFISTKLQDNPVVNVYANPAVSTTYQWKTPANKIPLAKISIDATTGSANAKKLFPLGTFVPQTKDTSSTKVIGSIPAKLDTVFKLIENPDNFAVDVVIDAGLSTIAATVGYQSSTPTLNAPYDDTAFVLAKDLTTSGKYFTNWYATVSKLDTFVSQIRRDCVSIIDLPKALFVSGLNSKVIDNPNNTFTTTIYNNLKSFTGSLESSYMATYGNWIKVYDMFSSNSMWLPFSGYAAAVYGRSDNAENVWAAPAGFNRGEFSGVLDIAINPNQKQRDRIYELGINPVVYFNGDGYTVFGQKTMQTKPTAFDRINVRRLFLYLERAVAKTVKYYVFEPNTEYTRKRLKDTISPIFNYAKANQGLYDFMIVCDERNNTPEVIDNNELIVDIYLKPVRTAEFILVNFIATRTGQSFQELI